ncbi:DMT family transporter [Aestuariispira ectoiniformans]|uniref:DMT family transporter n=1 Tax=Aestuariispira ectoiniformans TaxID=2775080 RepID=UPI00223C2DDB|nr:DMT family transporter [Aestuariispira ectoiniformans]
MLLPYLSLAAAMALVGLNVPVSKAVVVYIPVFLFAFLRCLFGFVVLAPVLVHRGEWRLDKASAKTLASQAFFGAFLFNVFILLGVERTSAVSAGIITSAIPAGAALLAVFLFGEKIRLREMAVIGCAVLGICFVNLAGAGSGGKSDLLGNMLVLGAVLAESYFLMVAQRASTRLSALAATTWLNGFAALMFLPMAIWELRDFVWTSVPTDVWLMALYFSATASVICYGLWFWGAKRVPMTRSGLFSAILPMSAVIGGALMLDETVTPLHLAGMLLTITAILLGVLLPARRRKLS